MMWFDRAGQDLRYAFRQFRNHPGFAASALLTLALGIGANTAVFSVIDAVLLRKPPYPASGKLLVLKQNQPDLGELQLNTSPAEYLDYRDRNRTFTSLAGYETTSFDLTGVGDPERVEAVRATSDLFRTLGVVLRLGRTFTEAEDRTDARGNVAVLSDAFWRRKYGATATLGFTIRLDERLYTVIGVMPAGFEFPASTTSVGEPPALWVPMAYSAEEIADRAASYDTSVVGRMKPGVTSAQADGDVKRIAVQFQREHPDIYNGNLRNVPEVRPLGFETVEKTRPALLTIAGAVAFILLIACANVANLFLARAAVRQRELAVRSALGANPGHLIRQLLTESVSLTMLGGVAGCLLAFALTAAAARWWPEQVVGLQGVHVDGAALLFTFAISVVTGIACGLAPALTGSRTPSGEALKQAGRNSGASRAGRRFRESLVMLEAGCAAVLLIAAALLIDSFARVVRIPPGFEPHGAIAVRTTFNRSRYEDAERRRPAEREIVRRLEALPRVSAVALTSHVPLADERSIGFAVEGRDPNQYHWAANALVSVNYFRVMGIPLLRGRTFDDGDTPDRPLAIVINETMAHQYWPREDALGKRVFWGGRKLTVVGVAGDVRLKALESNAEPTIYGNVFQAESGASSRAVFILRSQNIDGLANAARRTIWEVDRGLPVFGIRTLDEIVSRSIATRRFTMTMLGLFASMALALAAVGLYGVLSYSVTQRTRELGVRMALGALPSSVARLVIARGVLMVAVGLAGGLAVTAGTTRLMSGLLFGVNSGYYATYLTVSGLLLAVAVAASYIPARRAARLDPNAALRQD